MSRSSAGTYSLPSGNPVTNGQTITDTLWNTTHSDIGTELTNSLDRGGRGAMTAPLKHTDGTAALPSITFENESNSGLYRSASNDVRISINGAAVASFVASGVVFSLAATIQNGLTVTTTTTNGAGSTSTGNGTAAGFDGTGGATSGAGIKGTGGAPNGNGATLLGTGSGSGVNATGGSSNGAGITATGTGSGTGVAATGGTSNAAGGIFTGGATNGRGITALGTGTGSGINATGGATSGNGGTFTGGAPNGRAINATGTGTGEAIMATGGASASAIAATSGSSGQSAITATGIGGGRGLRVNSSATNIDVAAVDGYMDLSGATNPSAATGFSNRITPKNVIKAWGYMTTDGLGGFTLEDGFNVSCALTGPGTGIVCTFATNMANSKYAVTLGGSAISGTTPIFLYTTARSTSQFTIGVASFSSLALGVSFTVVGTQ